MTLIAMDANEVGRKILNKERLFVLDVRNEEDFKKSTMEGEQVEVLNIPYFDL